MDGESQEQRIKQKKLRTDWLLGYAFVGLQFLVGAWTFVITVSSDMIPLTVVLLVGLLDILFTVSYFLMQPMARFRKVSHVLSKVVSPILFVLFLFIGTFVNITAEEIRAMAEREQETASDTDAMAQNGLLDENGNSVVVSGLSILNQEDMSEYIEPVENVFTIYLSGVDTTGRPEQNHNSDVNLLITVNKDTRQILVLSTPRDYYIPIAGTTGKKDKLTHTGILGIDVSVKTLEMLYKVHIDDYVKVNFTGFEKIVDALGGITVSSEYAFSTDNYHFHVGENKLNGAMALEYARCRKAFLDGDRQRGKNQMDVFTAMLDKAISIDFLLNYKEILKAVTNNMVTSLSYNEISDLIEFQLNDMRGWEIYKYSVDGYDDEHMTYTSDGVVLYVMVPYQNTIDAARIYLQKIYAGQAISINE